MASFFVPSWLFIRVMSFTIISFFSAVICSTSFAISRRKKKKRCTRLWTTLLYRNTDWNEREKGPTKKKKGKYVHHKALGALPTWRWARMRRRRRRNVYFFFLVFFSRPMPPHERKEWYTRRFSYNKQHIYKYVFFFCFGNKKKKKNFLSHLFWAEEIYISGPDSKCHYMWTPRWQMNAVVWDHAVIWSLIYDIPAKF